MHAIIDRTEVDEVVVCCPIYRTSTYLRNLADRRVLK